MMNSFIQKIKNRFIDITKYLPVYVHKYHKAILLGGIIIFLAVGVWILYSGAYLVVQDTYEVFVVVRKVNFSLIQNALNYIQEQSAVGGVLPTANPFTKQIGI